MPPKPNPNGRQKDAIHFVNARPSSDAERLNIKRMVRAHVGKWISTQTKDKDRTGPGPWPSEPEPGYDSGSGSNSGSGSASAVDPAQGPPSVLIRPIWSENITAGRAHTYAFEPGSDDLLPLPSNSGSASSALSPDSSRDSPESTLSSTSHASHSSLQEPGTTSQNELAVAIVPTQSFGHSTVSDVSQRWESQDWDSSDSPVSDASSPSGDYIEAIGAGQLDPFRVYTGQYEPAMVRTSEEYCITCLWPGLVPDPSGRNIRTWFPMSLSDQTLFTAFLYGSLSHMRVQALNGWIPRHMFSSKQQRMLENVEMETVKMVSREIQNPSRAICDAVIFSVICMAHSQMDERLTKLQNIPFTSPMQRLQWLDVYGSLPPNLVHVQGLVQMVKLRGGIDKIKLPGLASIISFSDLVASTAFLSRPIFPFVPLVEHRRDYTMQDYLGYSTSTIDQFDNFLQPLLLPRIYAELLCAMNTYTTLVDRCIKGQMPIDTPLLADQRNIIHYTLVCQPGIPISDQNNATASFTPQEVMTESFRLAALIYSVGVIIPVSAQSTPLPKLASQLYSTLLHPSLWEEPRLYPQSQISLIWILVLGAIAATNTQVRDWFVERVAGVIARNKIESFLHLKSYLGVVAWYDVACDTPGMILWADASRVLGWA
ncbi:hypothetical protein BDV18DRAFT_147951 [Aspergillus unguis]